MKQLKLAILFLFITLISGCSDRDPETGLSTNDKLSLCNEQSISNAKQLISDIRTLINEGEIDSAYSLTFESFEQDCSIYFE